MWEQDDKIGAVCMDVGQVSDSSGWDAGLVCGCEWEGFIKHLCWVWSVVWGWWLIYPLEVEDIEDEFKAIILVLVVKAEAVNITIQCMLEEAIVDIDFF